MRREIYMRVMECAEYIVKTGATVRACAARYGISKSTVHKDMRGRLPEIDRGLAEKVAVVLGINKAQRHIRGGNATREKYSELRGRRRRE